MSNEIFNYNKLFNSYQYGFYSISSSFTSYNPSVFSRLRVLNLLLSIESLFLSMILLQGHSHLLSVNLNLPCRHTTSFRRLIDFETTSCVYWVVFPSLFQHTKIHNVVATCKSGSIVERVLTDIRLDKIS